MRILIIGNGLAGTISAKIIRELNKDAEIEIYAEEKYLYYPRPNLIDFMAGSIPLERMFAFPEDWYRKQGISVHLESPVKAIFPDSKEVEIAASKREKYDTLLLAAGYFSFIPPFKGTEKKGVFTLKTLDDAHEILEYYKDHPKVVVIGGGLLGLEIARALKSREAEVKVVEFFDRLLPRQLDPQGASLLKTQIEKRGISVLLGTTTEEILGQDEVNGLRFKGGEEIKANMAIIAAGIRPSLEIAKEAGLETDRGLIVNDNLQSSNPDIFAAGDIIQHRGRVYGIIPASYNQARVAASNIVGERKLYEGTIPSNTLKVAGLDLVSIGLVNPEEGTCEEFRMESEQDGIYKKIAVQNGVIVGAIWMGTKKGADEINRIISQKIDAGKWKDSLLEEDFDFKVI